MQRLDPEIDQAIQGALTIGRIDRVMGLIRQELVRAVIKHPTPMRSPHEAFGVIYEELDEMADEMRADNHAGFQKEAMQLAAMGARAILDLGDHDRQALELVHDEAVA